MVVDIIVLSPDEEFIAWLDSTSVYIEETSQSETIREITLEHSLNDDTKIKKWYRQGNKIWISGGHGLKPCLYVINQEYKIDYWQKETVTLEAEEVLVELNNVELYSYTGSSEIAVDRSFLEGVFGDYYDIGTIDSFVNRQNNKILPVGTMTLIELLRLIESETGMVFATRYEKAGNNVIRRYLDLKQVDNIGFTYSQALDIGYNTDNLVHTVSETDTYRAMAPKLSLSDSSDETSATAMTKSQLGTIISQYRSLAVSKGDRIPMIIEKRQENNSETEVVTAYWYAPFNKRANNLYVEDDAGADSDYSTTEANYNQIYSKRNRNGTMKVPKVGTVSTSETNRYAIYNACARALLEKRYPDIEIEVSVADLNLLVGDDSYFHVYDTVYVKIPGYNELIRAKITKTVKTPNDSGANRITVSNAKIGTKVTQRDTNISISDTTIAKKGQKLAGILYSEGIPLGNEIVSISFQKYVDEAEPKIADTSKSSSSKKSTKTKTVTEKVKRTDVITAWGYNTCACCGYPKNPYKKVRKTYLNKCPRCGKTMVLKDNPKKCKDGEITCSACGADFCINCGGDKQGKSYCKKYRLTSASEYTTVTKKVDVVSTTKKKEEKKSNPDDPTDNTVAKAQIKKYNIHKDVVAKARSICWGKRTDKSKMRAIADWMGLGNSGKIKYERYACTKRGARKTLEARKGNCADQAHLCIALARAVGVKARYVHRWNHYYGEYKIDGNWFVVDTVTSKGWGHYWSGSGYLIGKGNSLKGCKVS